MALNVPSVVGVGRGNRFFLFMCSRNCIIIIIITTIIIIVVIIIIIVIIVVFVVVAVMFQNRQVMVTSFACCLVYWGRPPDSRLMELDAGEGGCRGDTG